MKLLEKHFEIAINTPDGISRLRALILKLAAQGKLVSQDITEEPAREILKKIKSLNDFESINLNNIPFDKPDGWEWVRLGEIHKFLNGFAFKSNTYTSFSDNQIIRLGNVKNDGLILEKNEAFIPDNIANDKKDYLLRENDILITMTGTKDKKDYCFTTIVNKTDISSKKLFLNQRVGCLRFYENINPQLLNYFLKTDLILNPLFNSSTGTANQANIGVKAIKEIIIPLPPLEEQKRIVEKIEQLMSLCDKLEKQRDSKNDILSKINSSAINKLIAAEDEISIEEAAAFINVRFDELYSTESNLESLKKAILNIGISGKFKIASFGSKHDKKYPTIPEKEEPFKLPTNWIWTRLDNLGETQTGTTPPKKNPEYYGDYIPFLGPGDIKDFKIDYTNNGLSVLGLEKARFIASNSILMVCIGGSIGKMAINDRDVTCNQQVNTITPYDGVHLKYLSAVLQSDYFQTKVLANAGGSATPIINKGKWISIPIPLPSIDIQIEISDKIEKLLSLCNSLESSISQTSKKQVQILNSVLANI